MTVNVGRVDQWLRLALGVVLITLPFVTAFAVWDGVLFTTLVAALGLVLIVTALFRVCPLYRVLGLKTCSG